MNRLTAHARHLLLGVACALSLPLAAQADPVTYAVPYAGAGNVADFGGGSGGWVGSIDETLPTIQGDLPSLVSVVTFTIDSLSQTLNGSFQFTTAADLASTIYGMVSASDVTGDFLSQGGQLSLNYDIQGGTGQFLGASGFGLAFLDYDPTQTFNNYSETGLLAFAVPEPGTLALAAAGLLMLSLSRRKGQPVN
jgi:hypothetical protein